MLSSSQLALAVAHADVASQMGFSSSARYFQTGEVDGKWWKEVRNLDQVLAPLTLSKRAFVIVKGDVRADVRLPKGGWFLIYGDLYSSVEMNSHSELIVAGNVMEGATILGNQFLNVFVGGDFAGRLCSLQSCKLWVERNMNGSILTGYPSTHIRVGGDCDATIAPNDKASLLYLIVDGFMSYESLKATAAVRYTAFDASIGVSDRPAGIHPKNASNLMKHHRSYNRWVIRSKR